MKPADLPYVKPKSFGYNASLYSDYYDMLMGYIDVQLDYRDVVRGRTNVPQGFTNMQQGLRMAEQMLSKRQSPNKQIIRSPTANQRHIVKEIGCICSILPASEPSRQPFKR
jgi:hypothetical protein